MPIQFLGMGSTNDGSEINRRSNGSFDPAVDQAAQLVRVLRS